MESEDEQERSDSSSSSGSDGEDEQEGEVSKPGSESPDGRGPENMGESGREAVGLGEEGEESDGEMSSAVAAASHQASKFLQDSDSEEETLAEEGSEGKREPNLQSVFGEDSNDEEEGSPVTAQAKKRPLDSDDELEGDVPSKRARAHSSSDRSVRSGSEPAEGEETAELSNGEEPGDAEKPDTSSPLGNIRDIGDSDNEEAPGAVGGGEGSGQGGAEDEEEEEEDLMGLQEEVAELVEEGGEVGGEEGGEGEGEEQQGSEDELEDDGKRIEGMSDWDIMMERRRAAMDRARRRRRRDGDLTCNDEPVMALIHQMREAAEEDRQLNLARKAATKKIQMLPRVVACLKKSDLQTNLIECGILTALSGWLTPLPDHSLPHLKIRESILDILKTYPVPDGSILKSSKIGKAIMLLYRHPKESKRNKVKAGKIINEWARPIFGLASDFKSMTRDEREERDYANLSQEARHRISTGERRPSQDDDTEQPQKPGDKGWIARARVPMPSTKGYVVRPKWNTEQEYHKKSSGKKTLNRYEKHLRKTKQEKMKSKTTHAVPISVEGRRMPL